MDHWLARPETVRKLWIAFIVALAALVLLDLVVHHHGHFTLDKIFGFGAWFGFLSCVALVALAKAIGVVLKRPDDYYDR